MNRLSNAFDKHRKQLFFILAATFFWGMLAHGYRFFNGNFSYDSLNELHGAIFGNNIKNGSGRFVVPIYRDLVRSDVTLPWLIGMLSLLWIGLAVFFVARMFRMESRGLMFLTAGIFTVNISVSATAATYLHDLDCDMLALLWAVAAVWLWKRWKWGWLPGAGLLTLSLGIYQSYLFTAAVLIMMLCILWLLDGERFAVVFVRGLRGIAMILLGGLAYFFCLRISSRITGIALSSGDYNSLDLILRLTPKLALQLAAEAYGGCIRQFVNAYSTYPAILVRAMSVLLLAVGGVSLAVGLRKLGWKEILLTLALVALLPLAANMLYVLMLGGSHDLMTTAIWMLWLLALLLSRRLGRNLGGRLGKGQGWLCMAVVAALLWGSVQFSNGMYLKKNLEQDAYLSLMTRVVGRMEDREDYVPGETPVVFVGTPEILNPVIPGFKDYWNVTGMTSPDVINTPDPRRFKAYFDYILNTPVLLAEDSWYPIAKSPEAVRMPSYPAQGCMTMRDGILVVKLGALTE